MNAFLEQLRGKFVEFVGPVRVVQLRPPKVWYGAPRAMKIAPRDGTRLLVRADRSGDGLKIVEYSRYASVWLDDENKHYQDHDLLGWWNLPE